jgi:hypothetical protein
MQVVRFALVRSYPHSIKKCTTCFLQFSMSHERRQGRGQQAFEDLLDPAYLDEDLLAENGGRKAAQKHAYRKKEAKEKLPGFSFKDSPSPGVSRSKGNIGSSFDRGIQVLNVGVSKVGQTWRHVKGDTVESNNWDQAHNPEAPF